MSPNNLPLTTTTIINYQGIASPFHWNATSWLPTNLAREKESIWITKTYSGKNSFLFPSSFWHIVSQMRKRSKSKISENKDPAHHDSKKDMMTNTPSFTFLLLLGDTLCILRIRGIISSGANVRSVLLQNIIKCTIPSSISKYSRFLRPSMFSVGDFGFKFALQFTLCILPLDLFLWKLCPSLSYY